jgi:hypothetical protein
MDEDALQSTNKLLKVIVALLLRGRNEEKPNIRQQIEILHDLGLKPVEIAEILGRTNSHVSKELSGIRKSRKSKV